jgi:hypothetical protein
VDDTSTGSEFSSLKTTRAARSMACSYSPGFTTLYSGMLIGGNTFNEVDETYGNTQVFFLALEYTFSISRPTSI